MKPEDATAQPKHVDFLYFAYGSNLELEQMKKRCPGCEPVRRFTIKGWKLVFRAVADVIRGTKDDVLFGALYRITEMDLHALDRYEGYRPDGKGLYDRVYFEIKGTGETGMFYQMTRREIEPPHEYYADVIRKGYDDWGLPRHHLEVAIERAKRSKPKSTEIEVLRRREKAAENVVRRFRAAGAYVGDDMPANLRRSK